MSVTYPPGLATLSQKIARVLPSASASRPARSSVSAKRADQPKRRMVWVNWVTVPP